MGLGNWLSGAVNFGTNAVGSAFDYFTDFDFSDPNKTGFAEDLLGTLKGPDGQINWANLIALGTSAAYSSGSLDKALDALGLDFLKTDANTPSPTGYQGGIPEYVAVQERVPQSGIATPKPGAMGQRYFSDMIYAQKPADMQVPTLEEAQARARAQVGLGGLPANGGTQGGTQTSPQTGTQTSPQTGNNAGNSTGNSTGGGGGSGTGTLDEARPELRAAGGLLGLAKGGYYLGGPTDGMADKVPARIDGQQEARLSDGEFVIPADVVSHLGNGNSNAGAQQLYGMMDRVRKARTGRESQGKQINPSKYMPGMRA